MSLSTLSPYDSVRVIISLGRYSTIEQTLAISLRGFYDYSPKIYDNLEKVCTWLAESYLEKFWLTPIDETSHKILQKYREA